MKEGNRCCKCTPKCLPLYSRHLSWLNSLQAFLLYQPPPGTLCHSKSGRSLPSVAPKSLMDYRVPNNPDDDNFHWALSSRSSPVVTATCESLSLCGQMRSCCPFCCLSLLHFTQTNAGMYKDLPTHMNSSRHRSVLKVSLRPVCQHLLSESGSPWLSS